MSEQADELVKKLGPEFSTLANDMKDIDPTSRRAGDRFDNR
jgi:hypothetical protein